MSARILPFAIVFFSLQTFFSSSLSNPTPRIWGREPGVNGLAAIPPLSAFSCSEPVVGISSRSCHVFFSPT